jgi:hypothetical protein
MKVVAALALVLYAAAAHAEPRAWTAAKKTLPSGLGRVIGINIAPLKASALFQQLLPIALTSVSDGHSKLDQVKTTCGIDATAIIDSIVLAMSADDKADVVIALKGTNQKALEECAAKIFKEDGKTLAITKDGALTRYNDDTYVKWLAKDMFAFAPNKDMLVAMTAGGLGKDAVAGRAGKLNTGAAIWGVFNKTTDLPGIKGQMTWAYGTVDLKGGNVIADVHVVTDNAQTATDLAAFAKQQIDSVKQGSGVPKPVTALLDSVTIKTSGTDVQFAGHATEADAAVLLGMLAAVVH